MNRKAFLLLAAMFICASRAADQSTQPKVLSDYTVTMKDGSVLVGRIQPKKVIFGASYGPVEVQASDFVNFTNEFLTLSDGSKFKGSFAETNLVLETPR